MMTTTPTLEMLATLLAYPDADTVAVVAACESGGGVAEAPVAEALAAFVRALPNRELSDLEELYVQTFDMNPDRALELGWHLFGETYERGSFLVEVRGLLRQHGVEESSELPDHLAHILLLLSRMEKPAADTFARKFVLPGVAKLKAGFKDEAQAYFHCITALELAVQAAHGEAKGA